MICVNMTYEVWDILLTRQSKNEMPGLPKETWSIVKYPKNSTINIPKT